MLDAARLGFSMGMVAAHCEAMGTLVLTNGSLLDMLGEALGYKSGLALNRTQLVQHLKSAQEEGDDWEGIDIEQEIRMHSEEIAEMFGRLLYAVGATPAPRLVHPIDTVLADYAPTPLQGLSKQIVDAWIAEWERHDLEGPLDPRPFVASVTTKYGTDGRRIAEQLIENAIVYRQQAIWDRVRTIAWTNSIQLESLFASESLTCQYGTFLDQRILDYLAANFDSIDNLNWRKFERLVAEFLSRCGYTVELGKGRGDGGVDIRAWRDDDQTAAPALLVQCKRQRADVPQVVVKALYADIVAENATSGLVFRCRPNGALRRISLHCEWHGVEASHGGDPVPPPFLTSRVPSLAA